MTGREFLNKVPIDSILETEELLNIFRRDRDAEIVREIDDVLSGYPDPRPGTISWGVVRSLEHIRNFIIEQPSDNTEVSDDISNG